ncbi:hypothetical protein [Actinoplanes sp. N902-109]|uniref:hypothetical protein n=1 Tax=Actinoplanes sp. (strain N902-109) TaxID=649831 RepID=UPI0003293B21|nr:hypothetical protein [Actinoplanes sp. N902-109]AGL14057.1 hypothetical protein L083_0547 [Actinoplanes sp. N902-109]
MNLLAATALSRIMIIAGRSSPEWRWADGGCTAPSGADLTPASAGLPPAVMFSLGQ